MSEMVPPTRVEPTDPAFPMMKRHTSIVSMFFALGRSQLRRSSTSWIDLQCDGKMEDEEDEHRCEIRPFPAKLLGQRCKCQWSYRKPLYLLSASLVGGTIWGSLTQA